MAKVVTANTWGTIALKNREAAFFTDR